MKKGIPRSAYVMTFCILLALVVGGCGSSGNKEGAGAGGTNVGDTVCTQCHSAVLDPLTQQSIIVQYERSSPHKDVASLNGGNGCEACHGAGSQHNGVGPIQYPDPYAGTGARCAACHDGVQAPLTDSLIDFAGSNHGSPARFTIEEGNACRRCHSHEGAVLGNIGGLTGNLEIMSSLVNQGFVPYTPTYSPLRCATCHEHGAGLRLVMARDNDSNLVNWNPDKNQEPGQFDLCTGCHTMYDYTGNTLLASGTAADNATGKPATGKVGYHETSWYRIIATTHYDNPATGVDNAGTTGNVIEGYNLRKNTVNPCFDCHGHEAYAGTRRAQDEDPLRKTPTTYSDWAQSGHAGGLLKAKYAAADLETDRTSDEVDSVMISGVAATDCAVTYGTLTRVTSAGDAWAHYDWDNNASRGSCQKCHTATGAANYLANPAGYVAANNNFSHLSGWTTTTKSSPQNELLYCWGCHSNAAKGVLYTPGPITAEYAGVSPEPVFPDSAASNICLSCHTGRESGESIKVKVGTFDNLSFINSHYLTAGGTVFGITGYQYAGRGYTIPAGDTHDRIGRGLTGNATVDTNYRNGPCVGCHMDSRDKDNVNVKRTHTFGPYTQYSPTDNLALNPVCVNCHPTRGAGSNAFLAWFGDEATGATFQGTTHRARYQAALEALRVLLGTKGYYFGESHPYFFKTPDNTASANAVKNWLSAGDTDTTGNTTGKNNMGAAFNYNLLKHDPGGVAHNRRYTRRLIYDAIDWVDDDVLNYSVSTTLNALDNATVYKASAISYILKSSTGTLADRY